MFYRVIVLKVQENFQENCENRWFLSMFSTNISRPWWLLLKNNLRILWNHIMKNFQVKQSMWHHHIHQNIFFWKLLLKVIIMTLPCWQQDSVLLTGPGIYPQIYHRAPCPAVLLCKGSNKQQRRGRVGLFRISQKDRLFHLLWQPSAFEGNLTVQDSFLHPTKRSPSPLQFGQEENWTLN